MKKLLFPIVVSLLFLSSCTVNEIYECPDDHVTSVPYIFDVMPNQWHLNNETDGIYLYSEWNCPAITQDVLLNGIVLAYFWDGAHDNILPYIRPYSDGELYFENIRFDIVKGKVTFIIETNDFIEPYKPNALMSFKVVVLGNVYH